ncbi:MAG: ABC transporter ATP-binding protein [Woeseiaceae bacterium]
MAESVRFDDRVDTHTELTARQTFRLLGRALKLLGKVRSLFIVKCAFALVSVLPPLLVPWILKIIVDQVILQQPFNTEAAPFPPIIMPFINAIDGLSPADIMLSVMAFFLVTLVLFGLRAPMAEQAQSEGLPPGFDAATQSEQALSSGGSNANGLWGLAELLLTIRMTQRLANGLRTRLMGRLTRLEMTTLDDQRIGDSVYRVMYDAPMLPEICYRLTLSPFLLILSTSISVYFMYYSYGEVSPTLVWIAAGIVPLILIVTAPLSNIARRVHQASRAAGAATTNSMEESVDNIAAVQSLGGTEQEAQRFGSDSDESFRRFRHTVFLAGVLRVISYSCATAAMAWAFVLITDDVISGTLTPGDYAVLWGLFLMLGLEARSLGIYWIELQKNVAAVRRVFFFIDYTSEIDGDTQPLAPIEEGVYLDQVTFVYPDGRKALDNVSLELPLGELVAIVGPTGAGKTTLAYLLPGYVRPTEGQVRFDEQDLAEVNVNDIRHKVTYVFQEHMLLSDSIRENLKLANPDATEEDMLEACRISGAMDFIKDMPDGLDTIIGKSGDTLSVGQKQRLSIARGLVRDTPIVVLDEPTAALDPQTENALMAALRDAAKGKLVIVIAHRLSTIRKADRIVFLEKGQVVDVGDHDSLMADPEGRYRRFVDLQNS